MLKPLVVAYAIILIINLLVSPAVIKGQNPQESPSKYYAITNANLLRLDNKGAEVLINQTVVTKDKTIIRIEPSAVIDIPDNATIINGEDKFLLPGLTDMHVHLERFRDPVVLKLFLSYGVTTVRNMDGRSYLLDSNISWKLNKATIDFRAERQFCSLWLVKNHFTFWITKTDFQLNRHSNETLA